MEIVGKVTETREFRQTVMNTVGDRSSLDAYLQNFWTFFKQGK